jgi:hypothetical protein
MKKTIKLTFIMVMILLMTTATASAKSDKLMVKGEVLEIGVGTLTVESIKGEAYVISVPEDLDLADILVGDIVLIKAYPDEDGGWVANFVVETELEDESEAGEETSETEGGKENSAYCSDEKQEKDHPFAVKLAAKYDVTVEYVMTYFCDGFGMGQIMLALKTSQIEGIDADADALLAERGSGKGWGKIWKDHGLIGAAKNGNTPPGLLNKPEKGNGNGNGNGNNGNGNGNGNNK